LHGAHGRVSGDPRIVDEDVKAAPPLEGSIDQGLNVSSVDDITRQAKRLTVEGRGRLMGARAVEVADDHRGSGLGEASGHGQTETLSTTGDDGDLVLEQSHVVLLS